MAKAGFWLKGARGKLNGASISGAAGGITVIRTITKPSNPQSGEQTNTRSKFKLISQLGSIMKDVINIKRDGQLSGRNQFASINFPKARYSEGVADINLNSVQITKSNTALGGFSADRSGDDTAVSLNKNRAANLDKVVYCQFEKQDNGELLLVDSVVADTAGQDGDFPANLAKVAGAVVIYAYGVKLNSADAVEKFGNISAPTAQEVAKLMVSSTLSAGDTSVTMTDGLTMAEGEDTGDSDDVEHLTVSVTKSGNGTATGGGRFTAGQTATLTATPDAEASFVAWKLNNASGAVVSTNPVYSFEVQQNITLCAVFEGGPVPQYQISASVEPSGSGSVAGAGTKAEGSTCTLVATPAEGMVFDYWEENGQMVSQSATYSFTVNGNRTLVANFAEEPESGFSNMTVNGSPFNGNVGNTGEDTIAGNYVGENATHVGMVTNQPTVGSTVTITSGKVSQLSSGGAFSLTTTSAMSSYYFAAVHAAGGANQYVVDEIYPYHLIGQE